LVLVIATACGASHITRINEQGEIIEGPYEEGSFGYYGYSKSEAKIANPGYIYFSGWASFTDSYVVFCYSKNLSEIQSIPGYTGNSTIPIDNIRGSVYVANERGGKDYIDVLDLTLGDKYSYEIPVSPLSITIDQSDASVWFSKTYEGGGLYKYNEQGEQLYYFPEYDRVTGLSDVTPDGSFWALYRFGQYSEFIIRARKHSEDGSYNVETNPYGRAREMDVWNQDGSLWLTLEYSELFKVNALGNVVFRYSGIGYIRSISVNQNDGSVWLTGYNFDIVHLDADGNELLHFAWFEPYVVEVAVDSSDNSVVVFSDYDTYGNIQPSSLGEIKAMFR
jgi:hypothetical protein